MRRLILLVVFTATAAASGVTAQAADAWIGTWTLNIAQSSYDPPELAPKSQITKITSSGDTFTVVSDGVNAQGQKIHEETTYRFDGKDYDVKGASDPKTTRVYTLVDDHHYSYSTKVNGSITTASRVAVTPDGKTRTITTSGRDAQGRIIRNFAVWTRTGSS